MGCCADYSVDDYFDAAHALSGVHMREMLLRGAKQFPVIYGTLSCCYHTGAGCAANDFLALEFLQAAHDGRPLGQGCEC